MDKLYFPPNPNLFKPEYSSCSTRFPKTFRWTNNYNDSDIIADVYIDYDLLTVNWSAQRPRFAWLCESPALTKYVTQYVKVNKKYLSYNFKALFTCNTELVGLEPNFYYCPNGSNLPWIDPKDYGIYTKTKNISMFCSPKKFTEGHQKRHQYAEKYRSIIDLFGGMYGSGRLGNGVHPSKLDGLKDYKYHIVIENDNTDKYYTEKLTDCFATGTIPIYWGSSKALEDWNKEGILLLSDECELTLENIEYSLRNCNIEEAIRDNYNRVLKLPMADEVLYSKIKELL